MNSANTSEINDEEVFTAFTRGDVSALGKLYDRYGLLVYRLIYRMLNNSQEAEDLTQEIFLNLQVSAKFDPQRSSFYTYLMMLTRSRVIDRLRSKRSKRRFWQNTSKLKDTIEQQKSDSPMEIVSIEERSTIVRNALQNLSDNQRQILELSYYEGLSQSEIAKRLNIPLGTVKTHSRRGLLQLRKNLHNLVN
ncbi:MAG: sigma-70 family RNA polymerase sigma factor [Pleurocapsa sp. MO_226.B13]|nr:sigma-70 family RNA polymerase sigma factor [Pleurocapsa sp. MO_226.B13]